MINCSFFRVNLVIYKSRHTIASTTAPAGGATKNVRYHFITNATHPFSNLLGRNGSGAVFDDLTRSVVTVDVVMVMMVVVVHQAFIHQQIQFVVLCCRLLLLRSHWHRGGNLFRRCRRLFLFAVGRFVPSEKVQSTLFTTCFNWSIRSWRRITAARPVLVFVFIVVIRMLRQGFITVRR